MGFVLHIGPSTSRAQTLRKSFRKAKVFFSFRALCHEVRAPMAPEAQLGPFPHKKGDSNNVTPRRSSKKPSPLGNSIK